MGIYGEKYETDEFPTIGGEILFQIGTNTDITRAAIFQRWGKVCISLIVLHINLNAVL